nr:helix-turn-helix transcriptional regulator [uncultured Merdimonas sp.]
MTYADAIAKRLLTICEKENITVNKLCTLSGVSHTTIQDIMTGKTKNITLRTLHRLAVGLNMTVADLLDFPEMNETIFEDE